MGKCAKVVTAITLIKFSNKKLFFKKRAEMRGIGLRKKALAWLLAVLAVVVGLFFYVWSDLSKTIVLRFGSNFADRYVMWQNERLKGAIDRELALALKLADSELVARWVADEADHARYQSAHRELEKFRRLFRSESFFVIADKSGHYFYSDKAQRKLPIIKTIQPDNPADAWYFATRDQPAPYTLNIDVEEAIGKTNLWINVPMRLEGRLIGIAGTGVDITAFIDAFIHSDTPGLSSFILDEQGAIIASRDRKQMNLRTLVEAKDRQKTLYQWMDAPSAAAFEEKLKNLGDDTATVLVSFNGTPHIAALAKTGELGWVTVALLDTARAIDTEVIFFYMTLLLVALIAALGLLGLLMDRTILQPLKALSSGARAVAQGDYATRFSADKQDEIGQLENAFNEMAAQVAAYTAGLETKVAERTAKLEERNQKVTTLLNSSKEGFLSFGPDFIVEAEYSKECEQLFAQPIAGKNILTLLYPNEAHRQEALKKMLKSVWGQKSAYLQEVVLSLLPKEFAFGDRVLEARFGREGDKAILILKDVTRARALEKELGREKQVLHMVVEFVKDDALTRDLIAEFRSFLQKAPSLGLAECRRRIHTFKGNFLQKRFIRLPDALHQTENDLLSGSTPLDTDALEDALKEDIKILKQELGADYVESYAMRIDKNRLRAIEKRAKAIDADLHREIVALSNISLCDFMRRFEKTVERIAQKEEKLIRFKLRCDGPFYINYKENANLLSALTHLFSNAATHGIERPDERLSARKSEEGLVSCEIDEKADAIILTIEDDGAGIDLAALRQKYPDLAAQDDDVLIEQLFLSGISSRSQTDEFSGRGVGLNALEAEVKRIGGKITVSTRQGQGTKFILTLPKENL